MARPLADERDGASPHTWARRLACVGFWVVAWQLCAWAVGTDVVLAGPLQVVGALLGLLPTAGFWCALGLSLARVGAGLLLASGSAVLLAALAARHALVRDLLAPAVAVVKAVPVASFVILVLLWVPSSRLSVVISFLMAFPVVYTNVLEGLDSIEPGLLEMARVFGVRGPALACVYLQQVLPYLRAGLSLALGLSWKAGIAAEVIGLPASSVGAHLYDAKVMLDSAGLLAWTLAVVLVSVAVEALVRRALARACERMGEAA